MVLKLISQGLIIVFLLTFSFGPAFFALINAGIKEGYKHGSMLALGIVLSDLFLSILICILFYFGAEKALNSAKAQEISSIIGGIILIVFGITYFVKRNAKRDASIQNVNNRGGFFLISKGFLLNLFNPAVWILWLANVTAVAQSLSYSLTKMIIFFLVVLGAVFLIELGKVVLASKIKKYLTDHMMKVVNHVTGVALILFGIYLIYKYL